MTIAMVIIYWTGTLIRINIRFTWDLVLPYWSITSYPSLVFQHVTLFATIGNVILIQSCSRHKYNQSDRNQIVTRSLHFFSKFFHYQHFWLNWEFEPLTLCARASASNHSASRYWVHLSTALYKITIFWWEVFYWFQ